MLVSAEGEAWTASVSKTTSVKPGSAAKIRPNSPIKVPTAFLYLDTIFWLDLGEAFTHIADCHSQG